jgi:hypothetical protein
MAKKNNSNLLDKVSSFIERFVVLPHDHQVQVLSAWVIHTWAFEVARTTPYLYVHSPEKQSGKSLLLDVLSMIVPVPMATIDATGPVIFHAIEKKQPTLMFDEVDAVWAGAKNEGLRGILNGGYKIGGKVYRLKNGEVGTYKTFCPKMLAGIHNGYLPDTLVDRCIPITMRRKEVGVGVEPFMASEIEDEADQLKVELDEWADKHIEALDAYRQHPVEGLSDRGAEISWPLLAIAHEFGIRDQMAEAIASMIDEYREMIDETDEMVEMLHGIAELFEDYAEERPRWRGRLHTEEILEGLGKNPKSRADQMQLAKYLAKYDIRPYKFRVSGSSNANGYTIDQFVRLFGMYNIQVDIGGDMRPTRQQRVVLDDSGNRIDGSNGNGNGALGRMRDKKLRA